MDDNEQSPGWSPEVQDRIQLMYEELGGTTAAARVLGLHPSQIARWRDGRTRLPFWFAVELCRRTGRSLDWLAGTPSENDHGAITIAAVEECFPKWVAIVRALKHFDAVGETPSFIEDLQATSAKIEEQKLSKQSTNGGGSH